MAVPSPGELEFHEERFDLFPTRLFKRHIRGVEALNQQLREVILRRAETTPGVVRSNVGGWHSELDLLAWPHAGVAPLSALLESTLGDYLAEELERAPGELAPRWILQGWANVSRTGDYMRPHVHPNANFAVVYYVDAGDAPPIEAVGAEPAPHGALELLDPRNRVHMVSTPGTAKGDSLLIRPSAGMLLVFPAWVYHLVHPYQGDRPRISISCNATVRSLQYSGDRLR